MFAAVAIGLGVIFGLLLPRWWTLVCVPSVVVLLMGVNDGVLPESLHWWVALVSGFFNAVGIALGWLIRHLAARRAEPGV